MIEILILISFATLLIFPAWIKGLRAGLFLHIDIFVPTVVILVWILLGISFENKKSLSNALFELLLIEGFVVLVAYGKLLKINRTNFINFKLSFFAILLSLTFLVFFLIPSLPE